MLLMLCSLRFKGLDVHINEVGPFGSATSDLRGSKQ